jgi:hypothetical protein
MGIRCVNIVPPGLVDAVKGFTTASGAKRVYIGNGVRVQVHARSGPVEMDQMPLVVDFWVTGRSASVTELSRAAEALSVVRERLGVQLKLIFEGLKVHQEFLELGLPKFLASNLDTAHLTAALLSLLPPYFGNGLLPSVRLAGTKLLIGPEPEGVINSAVKFLKQEASTSSGDAALDSGHSPLRRWIPLVTAGLLLMSWFFPLRRWSVMLFAVLFMTIMAIVVSPVLEFGWRVTLRQTSTIAAAGFLGIWFFGILYAICALVSDSELGHVERLGYPILVSTGLGVAGGILGDNPHGAAQVVAHVQLLLFLGGVVSLIVALLRISRAVRERG